MGLLKLLIHAGRLRASTSPLFHVERTSYGAYASLAGM